MKFKNLLFAFLIVFVTFGASFAQKGAAGKTAAAEVKAVRAAFDALVAGIEDSDAEAVTAIYQNSPETLYFNNNGTVTRGWEQDKNNREARYPKLTNVQLIAKNVKIEMLGTTGAILTCTWTQTNDFDGKPETAAGRMTLAWKKIGKDWKIIHLHTSPSEVPKDRPLLPSERVTTN